MMLGGLGGLLPSSSASPQLRRLPSNAALFTPHGFSKQIYQMHPHQTPFTELYPNLSALSPGRRGFLVFAMKKKRYGRDGRAAVNEVEVEDFDLFEDDYDDEDGHGEEDDVIIPFAKMKAWLQNKPLGFGEGKQYDTSIEDKLLEETEQSRVAQLANVHQLKLNPTKPKPKKATEVIKTGIRVRIINLPKKKNIHRDLKSAFNGIPGIMDISPLVSGNRKTKDPICKGLAFVDFNSLDDANRFIHTFSGQSVTFGKIEKKLKCELLDSSDTGCQEIVVGRSNAAATKENDTSLSSSEDGHHPEISPQIITGGATEDLDTSTVLDLENGMESTMKSSPDLLPSRTAKQKVGVEKKSKMKKKMDKTLVSSVPGASKRLKVREKAVLAGVFSRYGRKVDLASEGR